MIVSRVTSFGLLFIRRLRTGGPPNFASSGLAYIWRGNWYNSQGVPVTTARCVSESIANEATWSTKDDLHLTFAGICDWEESCVCLLPWLRQLCDDTLVAAVATERELLLLYLVNVEDDVPALDMELRQLLDAIELALDANGRPLRVLDGETARSDRLSPLLP